MCDESEKKDFFFIEKRVSSLSKSFCYLIECANKADDVVSFFIIKFLFVIPL